MAVFGVKGSDDDAKEYLGLYSHRLERPPVSFLLDGQAIKLRNGTLVVRVEPRVPKAHYLGWGLLLFFLVIGFLRWWMLIPILALIAWGLFWYPRTYFWLMRWGKKRYCGSGDGLEFVPTDLVVGMVMNEWGNKKSTRGC